MQNAIPATGDDVAEQHRRSRRSPSASAGYADEVRRLLDAGLEVMRRVRHDVAPAGRRHRRRGRAVERRVLPPLPVEGRARRRASSTTAPRGCASYLAHQMAKEPTPEDQVRRWVEGVLSQARGDVAESTLAVMVNAGGAGDRTGCVSTRRATSLATLLVEPLTRARQHRTRARRVVHRRRRGRPAHRPALATQAADPRRHRRVPSSWPSASPGRRPVRHRADGDGGRSGAAGVDQT